jgi:starch synthase
VNILTVSHFYESHGGGIERVAGRLNREFARSGHHAVWAASNSTPAPLADIETVELRCFDPAELLTGLPMPIPGLRAVWALARAVRASDAVIVHDALYITSILATIMAKFCGKPVILIQHIASIAFANRALRALMHAANFLVTRPMLAAANHLVFISDVVRRELIGEPARRSFSLLYNGVDTSIFHPRNATSRNAVRTSHGLPMDAPIALFVGRFVEKKGLAVLRSLASRRPDLHVALVGQGPLDPASWRLPNVHLLGTQPQQALAELYRAVDLLLLPSVGEGFPLVVQEAMACGLSVVCGKGSAHADPDALGWLDGVEIDLAEPMVSASRCEEVIDRVLGGPRDPSQMIRYAAATYSWHGMAQAIVSCLS